MKLVPTERSEKTVLARLWTLVAMAALILALTCALTGCEKDAAEPAEGKDGTAATEQTAEGSDAQQAGSQEAATDEGQAETDKDAAEDASKKDSEGTEDKGSSDEAVKMSDMVGLWVLYEVQSKDEAMALSPDEVELYSKGGYKISLKLTVDGKAKMSRYGESLEGTWEFKSGTSGVLVLTEVISDTGVIDPAEAEKEAQGPATTTIDFKYADGKLHLTGPNKETEVLTLAD